LGGVNDTAAFGLHRTTWQWNIFLIIHFALLTEHANHLDRFIGILNYVLLIKGLPTLET
jgi:hypothetical protein